MHAASEEKSSKSFKKIPQNYQKMILVASSVNKATIVELNLQTAEFFKSQNILHANIMLNSHLEMEQIDCSISNAMTTSLLYGSFLWVNSVTPSDLACSVITTEDFMKNDMLYDGLVLDYSTKFEMSAASLKKLTKTQVQFPDNVEGTIEQIKALTVLCKLFFGRWSYPALGLTKLCCLDNKRLLRAPHYVDNEFTAKFMYTVDNRIYQWPCQCSVATSVEGTNTSLLDYSTLFDNIVINIFQYILPLAIKRYKRPPPPLEAELSNKSLQAL